MTQAALSVLRASSVGLPLRVLRSTFYASSSVQVVVSSEVGGALGPYMMPAANAEHCSKLSEMGCSTPAD